MKSWTLILDSGAGAAGVYEWMRAEETLRGADLIVFADRFNFPYGERGRDELRSIVLDNVRLVESEIERAGSGSLRAIVLASCTASMATAQFLREKLVVPVFDVITASAVSAIRIAGEITMLPRPALRSGIPPGDAIGILATVLTVESKAYRRAIHASNPEVQVVSEPGHELIRDIQGYDYSQEALERIQGRIREKISFFEERGVGVIVLGCTHFSLFRDLFVKEASGRMIIVDPTECIITELIGYLQGEGLLPGEAECGNTMLFKTIAGEGGGKEVAMASLPGGLGGDVFRLQRRVERFILSDSPSLE